MANHASHLDTPLILLSLPDEWRRRTAVAAAADYFFDTWWRAVGSAMVFNTFPIDRRGGTMATTPGDLLAEGWSLVIYPEGTRSKDGWVGRFQLGAAYLATQYGVPVVPIAHRGTFAAMPRGQNWPSRGRRQLTLRFGEPIWPGEDESPRDLRAPDPDGGRRAARRGAEHLVGGPAARRAGHHPRPRRPRRRSVAAGLGADRDAHCPGAHRASAASLAATEHFPLREPLGRGHPRDVVVLRGGGDHLAVEPGQLHPHLLAVDLDLDGLAGQCHLVDRSAGAARSCWCG